MTFAQTSSIAHLDFDYQQPCEHSQHEKFHQVDETARYIIRGVCVHCGVSRFLAICQSGLTFLKQSNVDIKCNQCGTVNSVHVSVVHVIGES